MITFDRTLVGALQPPLGQAEQPVYAGQQLMGLQPGALDVDRVVFVVRPGERVWVAGQCIADHDTAGGDVGGDELA